MILVFATHNSNKAKEIQSLLPADFQILTLTQINCHEEISETAQTLEGNSLLKAQFVNDNFNLNCDRTYSHFGSITMMKGLYEFISEIGNNNITQIETMTKIITNIIKKVL